MVTFNDIETAYLRINKYVKRTPIFTSTFLDNLLETKLFFKTENFQKVGAFKYRGATNAVMLLNPEEAKYGVSTHSSGNHAAALALAAKINHMKSYIVMPENSPKVKIDAVAGYGAEIFFCEPTQKAREEKLQDVINKYNATFIHPYDNQNVIAGQGTAAYEILTEIPHIDTIIAPVGGGGLISGTSICAKHLNNNIKVIAAEPEIANDAYRSFYSKKLCYNYNTNTIADGLRTSLSELTFSIIQNNVDDILTADEQHIIIAMRTIWERMKIVVEPSAALPLATILLNKNLFKNKNIAIILSGGNVDFK